MTTGKMLNEKFDLENPFARFDERQHTSAVMQMCVSIAFGMKWMFVVLPLLTMLVGCTTPRGEPDEEKITSWRPRYANKNLFPELKELPVKLNLEGCPEEYDMQKVSITGTSLDKHLPFKKIVEREFNELVCTNFCVGGRDNIQSKVELKVDLLGMELRRDLFGIVSCKVKFRTRLLNSDPTKNEKPYFKDTVDADAMRKDEDEKCVPTSLYEAVQSATKKTIDNIAHDVDAVANLKKLLEGESIERFELKQDPLNGKYYSCNTHVKWIKGDKSGTLDRAKVRIRERCHGIMPDIDWENSSILITETSGKDIWYFKIEVIIWGGGDFFMKQNPDGKTGKCFLKVKDNDDAEMTDEKKVQERIKKRIQIAINRKTREVKFRDFKFWNADALFTVSYECKF